MATWRGCPVPADLFGGVELGGTKCVAVLARGVTILDRLAVPTTAPAATLAPIAAWLAERRANLAALGIASFGPVRLARDAPDYGFILDTPKPLWSRTSVLAPFQSLALPTRLDTDVNAAGLAEHAWGAGRGATSLIYATIGTGIGTGILVDGRPLQGRLHPEGGHLRLGKATDGFPGVCPFHEDCVEGLLSGPALATRFGCNPASLRPDDSRWEAPVTDLARFLSTLLLLLALERILLGGSVALGQPRLVAAALARMDGELGRYPGEIDPAALGRLIVPPVLGVDAGSLGAIRLAQLAMQ